MIIPEKTYYTNNEYMWKLSKNETTIFFKGKQIIEDDIYIITRKNDAPVQLLMLNGEKPTIPESYGIVGFKTEEDAKRVMYELPHIFDFLSGFKIEKTHMCDKIIYMYECSYTFDPKADIKVFYSQPMSGIDILDIVKARIHAENILNEYFDDRIGKRVSIINNLQLDAPNSYVNYDYMSADLKYMKDADIIVFDKNYEKARGCRIEYKVAEEYDDKNRYWISNNNLVFQIKSVTTE